MLWGALKTGQTDQLSIECHCVRVSVTGYAHWLPEAQNTAVLKQLNVSKKELHQVHVIPR